MRLPSAAAFVILAVLAVAAAGAGEHPWNGKRIYYIVEYQGMPREKGFFVRRAGSWQRRPCVITEEERLAFENGDVHNPVRAVRVRSIAGPDGSAIQRREETVFGGFGNESIQIAGGEAIFESNLLTTPLRIPVPSGVLFEINGEWLASRPLRRGATYTAETIDRVSRTVVSDSVAIIEQISQGSGATPSVWLAEFTAPGRPTMRARFTSDGRLLRLESEGLIYQVVSREEYEAGRLPAPTALPPSVPDGGQAESGSVAFGVTGAVPAWDSFAWLVVQAVPAADWPTLIQSSEYSQVEYAGSGVNITTFRNAPRVDAAAVLPMRVPPDIQPYLTASADVPTEDPAVINAAYMAVMDADSKREEENVLRAISYLAGWINQNIAVQPWIGYESRAAAALADRAGDSVAQARLFAAMARSRGIPARLCQGMLIQGDRAAPHAWAEAWINGIWIPVDATVSRVGLPAGYVMVERTGPDGRFATDFSRFLAASGTSFSLVAAGRETPGGQPAELTVGNRRTYAFTEGDWLANLYWGFALRLPPGWTGSAKLDSVEITSPDGAAQVKFEAMAGSYQAGKKDLDATLATLRSTLRRFRAIDSRVVAFDANGAAPALFIDFTCQRDGANLRCRQYLLPRRQRAFRISCWAPVDRFQEYSADFDRIVATFEY